MTSQTVARAETMWDRLAIVDTVTAVAVAADARDWIACRAAFADTIYLDHDGHGATAEQVPADDVIASWQRLWAGFSVTFHEITNHRVDLEGDTARCRSYVRAVHVATGTTSGENIYTTMGHYDDLLVRRGEAWKITRRSYRQVFATGNPALFRSA